MTESAVPHLIELEREKQRSSDAATREAEAKTRAAEAAARASEAAERASAAKTIELEAATRLEQAKLQTMQQTDVVKKLSPDEIVDKVYKDATYTPPVRVRDAPKPVTPQEDKKKRLAGAGEVGIAALRLCGPALVLLAVLFQLRGIGGTYTPLWLLNVGLVPTVLWAIGLCVFMAAVLSEIRVCYRATMFCGVAILVGMCVLIFLEWRDLPVREAARRVLDAASFAYTLFKNEVRDVAKDIGFNMFTFDFSQRCFKVGCKLVYKWGRQGWDWMTGSRL